MNSICCCAMHTIPRFCSNEIRFLRDVRYVITLDADTPAYRLVPCAHWSALLRIRWNQPRHDPDTRQVIEGYGILQPRITPCLADAAGTYAVSSFFLGTRRYRPLWRCGIRRVSGCIRLGQLFRARVCTTLTSFELALSGKVPENTMLSQW